MQKHKVGPEKSDTLKILGERANSADIDWNKLVLYRFLQANEEKITRISAQKIARKERVQTILI
jgi:Pyruvate/2-oxoacid:ferredoxin oxidoreductase gamma subunit